MKTLLNSFKLLALVASISFLVSCGGNTEQETTTTDTTATTTPAPESAPPAAYDATKIDAAAPVTEITLDAVGATMTDMKYSNTEIHAKQGTTIKIKFSNKGVGAAMEHNFVLVHKGKMESVAMAGLKAGKDNNYIEPGSADILIAGKVLKPGESEEIIFAAPPAGEYEFVCTYPGHWQAMHGTFIVE